MNRAPHTIAQDLIEAWQVEHSTEGLMLGERTRSLLMEALANRTCQDVLRAAAPAVTARTPHGLVFLQREAERLACQDQYVSLRQPKPGMEALLFALPCSGATNDFLQWIEDPHHRSQLLQKAQSHLALLLGSSSSAISRIQALPFLLDPSTVATLTSDTRRALLHDLLSEPEDRSPAWAFIQDRKLIHQVLKKDHPLVLSEGVLLLAAAIETHWENEDSPISDRLSDLTEGVLDGDLITQAENLWVASSLELELPDLAFVPQPLSVNDALIRTLQAHMMSVRLVHQSPENLRDHLREDTLQVPAIVHLQCSQDAEGTVVVQAQSTEGSLPVLRISPHWAFIEGKDIWESTLAEAFSLSDLPQWQEAIGENEPAPSPGEEQGDHPAWKNALPAAPGLH